MLLNATFCTFVDVCRHDWQSKALDSIYYPKILIVVRNYGEIRQATDRDVVNGDFEHVDESESKELQQKNRHCIPSDIGKRRQRLTAKHLAEIDNRE